MSKEFTPFDFMNAVSFDKRDLIRDNENPELAEKQYNAYIINRGFSYFEDTILHANEMNQRTEMFLDGQFRYYLNALRKRKRFSKWHKAEPSEDLDAIQEVYQCNRTVAKQYYKVLSKDQMEHVHSKLFQGG
jgi:hypothetical protein